MAKYLAFFMCITNNDRASLSFPPEEMRHWRIDYCSRKMIEQHAPVNKMMAAFGILNDRQVHTTTIKLFAHDFYA